MSAQEESGRVTTSSTPVFLMRGVYKRLGTIHVVLASLVERVTECMVVVQYRLTWFGKSLSRPALVPDFWRRGPRTTGV